ncbi:linker between RRM2 and RRM3 domains in RBM39 protein-domain-containing protein [Phakopsora pachyrhizi]|uniref:Linker between RRM2 and RRM3 domains in RBM39 protein-domain-containing protein n=1 Tax=Phakopsora pachyrhizi TaxID=170000 RepID=A0AAV0BJP8_PHAPC|nr:linker between RRM2 and RRM3 domains in RBM39 protein-domain-containing protein [Phakopsora pachyrhizi]
MHNAKKHYREDERPPPALLNATAPGVASPLVVAPMGGNFTAAPANTYEERLEDPVGGNLNQISRVKLMYKLARTEQPTSVPAKDMFFPNIPTATSHLVLLKNMFNPEEETEWFEGFINSQCSEIWLNRAKLWVWMDEVWSLWCYVKDDDGSAAADLFAEVKHGLVFGLLELSKAIYRVVKDLGLPIEVWVWFMIVRDEVEGFKGLKQYKDNARIKQDRGVENSGVRIKGIIRGEALVIRHRSSSMALKISKSSKKKKKKKKKEKEKEEHNKNQQ